MTDVKKTSSTKNTHSGNKPKNTNYQKKPNYNNEKKYSKVEEVKEAKVITDDESEKDDKKLIVVIAIAILVIIATIIGLLVGCNREKEKEPEKKKEDIVIPVEEEEKEKEEEEIVVKKKTTKSTKKTSAVVEDKKEKVVEHDVIYYYNGSRIHFESQEEGKTVNEYVPQGYSSCKAYTDENHEHEYDFTTKLTDDTKLYLDCESNEYSVKYVFENGTNTNTETFTSDDSIALSDLNTEAIFLGWYLDSNYSKRVYNLDRNLIVNADENNNIVLYAKVQTEMNVKYVGEDGTILASETVFAKEYTINNSVDRLLGYSLDEGSKHITYRNGEVIELSGDLTLYAVCGDAIINYSNEVETVSVGYTDTELQEFIDEEIELPTPGELGMEPTTYFVPVDEETATSKKVVSDDELTLEEREVKLTDVKNNAVEGYNPELGDNVEELEKEFEGWNKIETTIDPETSLETETQTPVTTDEVATELVESDNDPAEENLGAEFSIPEESEPIVEG